MKKKLLFTFACVMALMAGFVSCTNDDFEEFAPVAEMQKSAMTRAVGGMTQEEVQARLNELGEKYGININMLYVRDYSEFTESSFEKMEQNIIAYKDRELNATVVSAMAVDDNLLDDSVIDEYGIATLSTNVEASQNYDATLDFDVVYHWNTDYNMRDVYTVRWGINFEIKQNNYISAESEIFDIYCLRKHYFYDITPYIDTLIESRGENEYYFDFHLNMYVGNAYAKIYGTYDNGFSQVYLFTDDNSLMIDIVEPE